MNKSIILKKLKEFGLSPYESKSYLSLLEKDSLTVAEVARIAGIPRPSVYEALEKLMVKGLCKSKPGDTKKYSASDPELFRERYSSQIVETISADNEDFERREAEIIEKYEREKNKKLQALHKEKAKLLKQRQAAKENIVKVADELKPYYDDSRAKDDSLDYIEVLKNPLQIHRKFVELFNKAEKEVLAFTRPPLAFGSEEQRSEQADAQTEALARNVILKNIVQMPSDELIKIFAKHELVLPGEAVEGRIRDRHTKFIDELPAKLFIFDEKVCFFALEDPIKTKTSLTMLVAEHEAMAKSFKLLFETIWDKAKDYFVLDNKKYYMYEEEDEE